MSSVLMQSVVSIVLAVVFVFLLAGLLYRLERANGRAAELARLEAKVDLLLKHANIAYDPYLNVAPDIVEAARTGAKIKAIKLYRRSSGAGLKESKDYVEGLQRRLGAP